MPAAAQYRSRWTLVAYLLPAVMALFLLFAACSKKNNVSPNAASNSSLLQPLQYILENNLSYHSFDTLLKRSSYYQRILSDSSYTILLPDNTAFATAGYNIDSLLQLPPADLDKFVGYHLLAGAVTTDLIPQTITNPMTTLSGQTLYLSKPVVTSTDPATIATAATVMRVNGITINLVNLRATNGVVHVLNYPLLLPCPSVQSYLLSHPQYSYLVAALKKFKLFDKLDSAGPYTIFAPSNAAFLKENVDSSRIYSDTFDLAHYQPWLFSSGVLDGRIFTTDFTDVPSQNILYSPYGTLQVNGGYPSYTSIPGLQVTNYYQWLGPNYAYYNSIGPQPGFDFVNQPAINGVINGINDLMVYPDSVYLGQR